MLAGLDRRRWLKRRGEGGLRVRLLGSVCCIGMEDGRMKDGCGWFDDRGEELLEKKREEEESWSPR